MSEGVWAMREPFGPGWRMSDILRGHVLIVMLGSGNNSTQQADITAAQRVAASLVEDRP